MESTDSIFEPNEKNQPQYRFNIGINEIPSKDWFESITLPRKPSIIETSQERMERKIDTLLREVATREDIINQTQVLIREQERTSANLQEKLEILRSMQESNVPHKRLAKYSLSFFIFFAFSFLSKLVFDIVIITPLWNNIGLIFSFGFLAMAIAMGIDWKEKIKKG